MRLLKFTTALLLLPLLWASFISLGLTLRTTASDDLFWVPFIGGVVCFLLVLAWLPKPMWAYVVGHELTHAIWTMAFGGRVKKFKATRKGGSVTVTKSNLWITLAPYFFPLYTVICIACYSAIKPWIDAELAAPIFHSCLGFTLAFHILMNIEVLKTRQPDWETNGYFFSAVLVLLMNTLIFGSGLGLLESSTGLLQFWRGIFLELRKTITF